MRSFGSLLVASTASCPNQAFRYGARAYGFQFHLEADAALVQYMTAAPVITSMIYGRDPQ